MELDPRARREIYRRIGETLPPSVSYQKRGEYWYGFFRIGKEVRTVYIGKDFREIDDPVAELKKMAKKKPKKKG